MSTTIEYRISPAVSSDELNALFAASWPDDVPGDVQSVLERSLAYVCAYHAERLIGFVNLAWDGGIHAFLLDTTVHPEFRRRGIGRRLVREAIAVAGTRGIEWVHVDFEPHLRGFYRDCGFKPTEVGLVHLSGEDQVE